MSQSHLEVVQQPMEPPLPRWAYKVVNPAMNALLRSPLHGLLSKALMILIFDGRKTGQRYTIPVGYQEVDGQLFVFSHSKWALNFRGGAPLAVRLRGELVRGTGKLVNDAALIDTVIRRMAAARGEAMAERMGLMARTADGQREPRLAPGTTFIEITLAH